MELYHLLYGLGNHTNIFHSKLSHGTPQHLLDLIEKHVY